MDRLTEHNTLRGALMETPPALEYTVTRAKARHKASKRIHHFVTIPVGGLALFMVAFVVTVNASMTFAAACGRIPLIRVLAEAVTFSPSLNAAVLNEYVQPIEQEQTKNGITVRVEHVIVDQKQLNIFYTLTSELYTAMAITPSITNADGDIPDGGYYIYAQTNPVTEDGALRHISVDFDNNNVPESLVFSCRVHDNGMIDFDAQSAMPPDASVASVLLGPLHEMAPEAIAAFDFTLIFDPLFTQKGETITLDKTFTIDGQTLTATTVEIYPTHLRLNLLDSESNTAWHKTLGFYIENEHGERFETIKNGITATSSVYSPLLQSHRLESPFFYESEHLTLHITDVEWLCMDKERVRIDLANGTAEALPEGITLERTMHTSAGWELTFACEEWAENYAHQLFMTDYTDENGNFYEDNSFMTIKSVLSTDGAGELIEREGVFFMQFLLAGYHEATVYFSPAYLETMALEEPVAIEVK